VGNKTVWVIRPLQDVQAPKWYFDDKGRALTADKYEQLGHDASAIASAGYSAKPVAGLEGWKTFVDGEGQTWYRDPDDGHLYPGKPPFQTSVFGPVFNYAQFVGDDGKIDMDQFRVPASTGRGYVAYFSASVSPREAQELTEAIVDNPYDDRINLDLFHKRDDKNFIQPTGLTPDDVVGMYWTPATPLTDEASLTDFMGSKSDRLANGSRYYLEAKQQAAFDAAEARRKAEVQGYIDQRIGNQKQQGVFEAMAPDLNLRDYAQQQIESAKELAGIKLGSDLRQSQKAKNLMNQFAPPEIPQVAAPLAPNPIAPIPVRAPKKRRSHNDYVPDFADSGKINGMPF
jgi:hypothetical protein